MVSDEIHGVSVETVKLPESDKATIEGREYPNGDKNYSLTPEKLRDVANMLNNVADEMEGDE